jgi:transketolase
MRQAFIDSIVKLAESDPRILLLTGDLGYTVIEPFSERFPDRFFNVGVAEQNMVGIATGLAEAGFIPFVYSIATFACLRPYEFIRNGPIMHKFPVRIVGVGGGFDYGHAGATHHGLEDVGVMRIQPGITVVAPADYEQARSALLATWDLPGPVYYRLGKDEKNTVPGLDGCFEIGRTQMISEGDDLLFIAMGNITREVIAARETLASQGISCAVMVIASLNPAPIDDLVKALARFPLTITVESHYITGGVGSLVSEVVAERGINCRVVRCGVKTMPDGISGSERYLCSAHGVSAEGLVKSALCELREGSK